MVDLSGIVFVLSIALIISLSRKRKEAASEEDRRLQHG